MYPKCGIDRCGSRTFRLVHIFVGKEKTYLYQCSNGHVFTTKSEIAQTENPLAIVSDVKP